MTMAHDLDALLRDELVDLARHLGFRDPEPWRARAACRGANTELFFPGRGADLRSARALCESCPVSRECLDVALEDDRLDGIWGGLTSVQRRAMRRQRRVA
jgi:WhiB family redox-sensing transcriptional regulator